jgi:hypothetical protein
VVAELVPRVADLSHERRIGERGLARDEERCRDLPSLQKSEDPWHGDRAELAA